MKKEKNKTSEQLSSKTSSLIIIVSCISVLMLIAYFGVSLTSKGTFSAETYTCPTNSSVVTYTLVNTDYHYCCNNGYSSVTAISGMHAFNSLAYDGVICVNDNYSNSATKSIENGVGICSTSTYGVTESACSAQGGEFNEYQGDSWCSVSKPCAVSPTAAVVSSDTNESDDTSSGSGVSCELSDYSYLSASDGKVIIQKPSTCNCLEGWSPVDGSDTQCYTTLYTNDATGANYEYYAYGGMGACWTDENFTYNSGSCQRCIDGYHLSGSRCVIDAACQYSYVSVTDSIATVSKSSTCTSCPSGGWTESGDNCTMAVTTTSSAAAYTRGGMSTCYTGYAMAADGKCRKCNDGYVFPTASNTNNCVLESSIGGDDDSRCGFGDYNESTGKCDVTCDINVVTSGPTKEACENVYKGYTCTAQTSNVYLCSGNLPTCTVEIDDCILEGNINDGRVNATVTMTTPVTYKYKWEFSGAGYAGGVNSEFQANWQSIPGKSLRIDTYTVKTNASGTINAKITVLLSTGASCVSDPKTLTVVPCTDCGTISNEQRCNKTTGSIVTVTSCDMDDVSSITCSSNTDTSQGYCTLAGGTRIQRCSLAATNNAACATPSTDSKTCYYCDGSNALPITIDADDECSNHIGYYDNPSQSNCTKRCYFCDGTTIDNRIISKDQSCSNFRSDAVEDQSLLNCTEEFKCCTCDGEDKVEKGDSTNGVCPSGQTKCDNLTCSEDMNNVKRCYNNPSTKTGEWVTVKTCDTNGNAGNCTLSDGRVVKRSNLTEKDGCETNVDKNPQTGTTAIIIAWIVGILAIGYSFYYFRQTNKQH